MKYGVEEMGVRGSICESDFIVGAGAAGGVSAPWAWTAESWEFKFKNSKAVPQMVASLAFMIIKVEW
jgi:hypothetical protein